MFTLNGVIEYIADVFLSLQQANMEQIKAGMNISKSEKTIRKIKGKSERDMEIVILKNRNGKMSISVEISPAALVWIGQQISTKNDMCNASKWCVFSHQDEQEFR